MGLDNLDTNVWAVALKEILDRKGSEAFLY